MGNKGAKAAPEVSTPGPGAEGSATKSPKESGYDSDDESKT